jgi:Tol biopolymer transport system component
LAAVGDDRGLSELHLATADITALYEGLDSPGFADWSPDASKVAYVLTEPDGSSAIEVANADGSDPVRILDQDDRDETLPGPDILNVSWSPDGTQLAYTGRAIGLGRTVLVMNTNGTGEPKALGGTWFWVSWSPVADRLLLVGFPTPDDDGETPSALYTMRSDGSDLTLLTGDEIQTSVPSWSPDGSQIVFSAGDDYDQDAFVMDADGSDIRQLTARDGLDGFPVWSPDGDWIVFSSDRDATAEQQAANRTTTWSGVSVYVMRPDGSDVRRIFDAKDGALLPADWISAP